MRVLSQTDIEVVSGGFFLLSAVSDFFKKIFTYNDNRNINIGTVIVVPGGRRHGCRRY